MGSGRSGRADPAVEQNTKNAFIMLAVRLFGRGRKRLLLRMGTVAISVLTLFLIGTALTKMFLYIQVYGLTPLRVIPSVFMVFLAVVFLLAIAAQFRKLPVATAAVCVFALGYSLLSVSDMDGRIAAYNLARYEAGTLDTFPETVLVEGSLASVAARISALGNLKAMGVQIPERGSDGGSD